DPSAIDYIGGRYTVYANKQIIRTYIANGKVRIEEVDHIPASRSHGNVKRILDGEVISATENIILEYSGIYDGYRAVTGKDPETNQNISSTDQALSAVSIIPFMKIIKGGKYVFKIDQGKHVVKRVTKIDRTGKTTKATISIASEQRTKHILYGDKTGGGHLWPGNGNPNKTLFPKSWNAEMVMYNVSDIATDTKLDWKKGRIVKGVQRYEVIGIRDGIKIKVITDGKDIITAFPIK
ncbi:pre-toxin TG domain-containing protein, partial [Bacillus altitudinis]|uniref:pre-toxin TG domain-containing protein n=1 Tax=Bacillus altitudinis TaxID=293387 RepID=UPI003F7C2EA9